MSVEIKWDTEYLRKGDRDLSQDKLMRSKWNSNMHKQEMWQENLHHMAKTREDVKNNYDISFQLTVFWLQLRWELYMVYMNTL